MVRLSRAAAALAVALAVAACSSTGGSSPGDSVGVVTGTASPAGASASAAATDTPAPTPSPTALSGGGQPSESPAPSSAPASQVAINPCMLLTDAQASAINGVTYGPGAVHPLARAGVECVWSNSATGSITLQVAVAPDSATAKAAYTAALADVQQAGSVAQVPNIGDMAVIGRVPASIISTGGIYVLDGATFFDVVYLLGTVPSDTQLTDAATLILGELP